MSIKVLKPGLATSVQDAGREGHYHLGIRRPARSTSMPCALPTCWWATHRPPPCWSARCWVRSWSSSATPWWPCAGRA